MQWRDPRQAGLLMTGYVLIALAVGPVVFAKTGTGGPGLAGYVWGALASAFFAWRVTRGGRISRMLLLILVVIAFALTASMIASRFGPLVFGLLIGYAAQLAVLLSPAVYRRTRPLDWDGPAGWARVRPPAALMLLAALTGLVATLLGLSHPRFAANGGMVADGFPLTWVTAGAWAPLFRQPALLTDTAAWSLVTLAGCLAATPSSSRRELVSLVLFRR